MSTPATDVLHVGDLVTWRGGWGNRPPREARVRNIELLPSGNPDDGIPVMCVPWSEVRARCVVVDLDNGHWAYGEQITRPQS